MLRNFLLVAALSILILVAPGRIALYSQEAHTYTIIVSSLSSSKSAENYADKLNAKGTEARVIESEIPGHGTKYRIALGDFSSVTEAKESMPKILKKAGLQNGWILETNKATKVSKTTTKESVADKKKTAPKEEKAIPEKKATAKKEINPEAAAKAKKIEDKAKVIEKPAKISDEKSKKLESAIKKSEEPVKKPAPAVESKKTAEAVKRAEPTVTKADDKTKIADEKTKKAEEKAKKADERAKIADEKVKIADQNAKKYEDLAKKMDAKEKAAQASKTEQPKPVVPATPAKIEPKVSGKIDAKEKAADVAKAEQPKPVVPTPPVKTEQKPSGKMPSKFEGKAFSTDYTKLITALASYDYQVIDTYINPECGLYIMHKPDSILVVENISSYTQFFSYFSLFSYLGSAQSYQKSLLTYKTLPQYDETPFYDPKTKTFNKQGAYYFDVAGTNMGFQDIIKTSQATKNLVLTQKERKIIKAAEENITCKVVNTNGGMIKGLYFSYINKKWYITMIDFVGLNK